MAKLKAIEHSEVLAEILSPTYMDNHRKMEVKFSQAILEANWIWMEAVIDLGKDSGHYDDNDATEIFKAAQENLASGSVDFDHPFELFETGDPSLDQLFEEFLREEGDKFDEQLEFTEEFICYASGDYDDFDMSRDTFKGNKDDIECVIGIDYASGANIGWIKGEDDVDFLDSYLNEQLKSESTALTEAQSSNKLPFTKQALDKALDNLPDSSEGLYIGYNDEDRGNVTTIGGEPYSDTRWYVDKYADNVYIVYSELYGASGEGPEEGVFEEFDSLDELWEYLEQLEELDDAPKLESLNEWIDSSGNKITIGTASSAAASSNSKTSSQSRHKQEFIDLITYMVNHKDADVIATEESDLTGISFTYAETHKRAATGEVYTIKVCCDFINAWTCKVYKDQKLIEDTIGQTWEELLRLLNAYFNAPTSKDPLYRQLVEWVDASGNKVNLSNSPATPTPQKTKKRTKAKTMFGMADSYQEDFRKLYDHLLTVNQQPNNSKDERVTPVCLRAYWIDKQGKERRLEVTTTKVKDFKITEQLDYVLSVFDPDEKIISRGYLKDYDALLDILLKTGDIQDKTKCQA